MRRKYRKGQVIFIETICVICIYVFLLGFMLSTFQVFHTKMVFNIAAYEGARTAVMAMDDEEHAQDITKKEWYMDQNTAFLEYDYDKGKARLKEFCRLNSIGSQKFINNGNRAEIFYTGPENGVYVQCVVHGNVRYVFPLVSPTFVFDGSSMKQEIAISEGCTMARRRIYKGMGGEAEE